MSSRQASRDVSRTDASPRGRRSRELGLSRRRRAQVSGVSGFQRSRLLAAALEEASQHGRGQTSVAVIIARARLSRKTFYDLFENRDDCFRAVFEQALTEIADVMAVAYEDTDGNWSERLRAALAALMGFLELHRDVAAFTLAYLVEDASRDPEYRALVLKRLRGVVERGRSQANPLHAPSPLAAEVVVGGALAVLHARVRTNSWHLGALVNPLMWMIVLPYLGPAAASSELQRTPPKRLARPARSGSGPLDGVSMRMTYRTSRVLKAIAEDPGGSNQDIGEQAGITDPGQASKLLARLLGNGLIENIGPGWSAGGANAWQLTRSGEQIHAAMRHQFAANGARRSR
jgi:AcrR family transcriptional regulator